MINKGAGCKICIQWYRYTDSIVSFLCILFP